MAWNLLCVAAPHLHPPLMLPYTLKFIIRPTRKIQVPFEFVPVIKAPFAQTGFDGLEVNLHDTFQISSSLTREGTPGPIDHSPGKGSKILVGHFYYRKGCLAKLPKVKIPIDRDGILVGREQH